MVQKFVGITGFAMAIDTGEKSMRGLPACLKIENEHPIPCKTRDITSNTITAKASKICR